MNIQTDAESKRTNEIYLKKLRYYEHLTDSQKEMICHHWMHKAYKKGQIIHGFSEECLGQILMIKGEVRAYIISEEGREITLFRLNPFETCVLSASCVIAQITFDTQIIAQTDCEMLVLSSGVFSQLTEENIYVKCCTYELLTTRFSTVMFTMQQIIFKGFDRRLAAFLLSEAARTGSEQIKMTHEQIAQHTNSAREVVARMLKRFASDGLIEFKRGAITLIDTDSLKELE